MRARYDVLVSLQAAKVGPLIAGLLLLMLCGAQADRVYRWEFEAATNYALSNPDEIEVADDVVRLKRQVRNLDWMTISDYTNGTVISSLHLGPQASVGLTREGGLFAASGIFESQIFDRGATLNTWQALVTRVSNRKAGSNNSASEILPGMVGLLGLWHFNNSTVDEVSGRSGTVVGATYVSTARFGPACASFDGQTARIDVPFNPETTEAFTISVWLYARKTEDRFLVIPFSFLNASGQAVLVFALGGGGTYRPRSVVLIGGSQVSSSQQGTFTDSRDANRWRHIVIVYNKNASPRTTIYKDGEVLPMAEDGVNMVITGITSIRLGIRADLYTGWSYFGYIDELAVFNTALSRDDVLYLYNLPTPVKFRVRSGSSPDTMGQFVGFDGTPSTFFLNDASLLPTNNFDVQARYVQYQVALEAVEGRTETPYIQSVAFLGTKGVWFDYSLGDYLQGRFVTNTTPYPTRRNWSYIGLAKKPNGGYFENGWYVSRILDVGQPSPVWDAIAWQVPVDGIAYNIPGLVRLWPMDQSWADASGKGGTVYPVGGVDYTTFAKIGTHSCTFDGSSGRVPVGNVGIIKTIEFWINDRNPNDSILSLNGGAQPHLSIVNGYVQPFGFGGSVRVFVNGSEASSKLLTGWNHVVVMVPDGINAPNMVVGMAEGDYFQGALDDMALYDRGLTPAEISFHFETGRREIAGRVGFQARAGSTISNLLSRPFTGPGGDTNAFYRSPAGSALYLPDEQYMQYRIFLESDGNSTPGVGPVTVSLITAPPFEEDAADELGVGTFVDDRTWWYGDDMAPVKVAAAGPFNLSGSEDANLGGLWHMDEGVWTPGPSVRDSSPAGRDGTPQGGAEPTPNARVGLYAGSFNGSNAYVTLPAVDYIGSADFTVALWFRTSSSNRAALISCYSDNKGYFTLEINGNGQGNTVPGKLAFIIDDYGVGGKKVTISVRGNLNDDRWHHVAGVRRGGYIHIYVDGDRVGSTEIGTYGNVTASSTLGLAKYGILDIFYRGYLDEVLITKRAMSEGEIGELAAAGYQVTASGQFTSPVVDAGQPVVWGRIGWGASGPSGSPLSPTDPSMVGLWHLDVDGSDATTPANNGTVVGATFIPGGVFTNCLYFSGSGSRVTIPDDAALEPGMFTIEAWVKPGALDSRTIVDKRDATGGYALGTDVAGRPCFWLSGTVASDVVPLNVNEWAHIAGMYDGSVMRLYVNGEPRAVERPVPPVTVATASSLKFGERYNGGENFMGAIDEVALHNRALLPEEVVDHYRAYALRLRFQARAGNVNPIPGPFVGPDGTTNSYFTTPTGSDMTRGIPTARYFQFRGYLGTRDYKEPPVVRGVRVNAYSFSTRDPYVYPLQGFEFPGRLLGFTHSRSYDSNMTTDVKYQVTGDRNMERWFYWDTASGAWSVADPLNPQPYWDNASYQDLVHSNIATLFDQYYSKEGGVFRFKAFLHSQGDQPMHLDWVEVVGAEGRLVILEPNGTETNENAWLTGVPYEIRWLHGGRVDGTVKLEYSTDGGRRWNLIASGVNATLDRYPWTTPDVKTEQALVRIVHEMDPSISDQSDGMFHLVRRFRVLVPNGGEKWYIGETNTIWWDSARGLATLDIDYFGRAPWSEDAVEVIHFLSAPGGARSNSYNWVVPATNPLLPSLAGKIRIQTGDPTTADYSDEPFTLAGAAIFRPWYGDKVRKDVSCPIRWNSADCGPRVRIEFQSAPGAPRQIIATNVPNVDGENVYNWMVDVEPTFSAKLYVFSQSDPRARGESPVFTISAIRVIDPHGDPDPASTNCERWFMGTTNTIRWFSAGASPFVNLYYSTDQRHEVWKLIKDGVNNPGGVTNSYQWRVPLEPSAYARVIVQDTEDTNLVAMSPFDFHIAGVSIVWPNGPVTQIWAKGSAESVTWVADEVGENALLEFSYDGGLTWTNIVPGGGLVSLGSFKAPPYAPTNPTVRALVRITPTDPEHTNKFDTSDAFFTVAGIRIERPAAREVYTIGTTNVIRFVAAGTYDSTADIYYSPDGVNWDPIPIVTDLFFSEDYPGITTYDRWGIEPQRKPSANAVVKVVAGAYTEISAPFVLRGIRFEAPAAGSIWGAGLRTVRWTSAGIAPDARVDLYVAPKGRSGPFELVATNILLLDNQYDWTIPERIEPGVNAVLKLRVVSTTNATDRGFEALSEPFTLQGIALDKPARGEVLRLGERYTIRWKAAAAGDSVDLYYSVDGGRTYDERAIALVVPSADGTNNTYEWSVEMMRAPSTGAVIKIVSSAGLTNESALFRVEGIRFERPNARTVFSRSDTTNMITWVAVGDDGPYTLKYFRDGMGPYDLAAGIPTNRYNWSAIPTNAISSNVVLEVSGVRYTNWSEAFQIVPAPAVFIVSPRPGAFWKVRKEYLIEWSRGGFMLPDFAVYYQLASEGYSSNHLIAVMSEINYDETNNVYWTRWLVPDEPGQARIVVRDLTPGSSIGDVSGIFNLVGQFQMWIPNGGQVFFAGKPTTVQWLTIGRVPAVSLYYSATPPYLGPSWQKINTVPIPNKFNEDGSPAATTYQWPVARIPYTPLAKLRVVEDAYTDLLFDEGVEGPYDSSDNPFTIRYYRIYWMVLDGATMMPLDNLSVADSSGWSASALSCVGTNVIYHDYPWGYWNTLWYRRFFHDCPVLGWNPDNPVYGGAATWTQTIVMVRAEIEAEYRVLANFSYDFEAARFDVRAWMERGGEILLFPVKCTVSVYDGSGNLTRDTSPNPITSSSPASNGVFQLQIAADNMSKKAVYFAKVEIEYAGQIYSSGLTFTLQVPASAGDVEDIVGRHVGGVSNLVGEVNTRVGLIQGQMGEIATAITGTTNLLTDVTRQLTDVTNMLNVTFGTSTLVDVIGPLNRLATNVEDLVTDTASSLARILTRPTTVEEGTTNKILYKTRRGYRPGEVWMEVLEVGVSNAMQAIGNTGIYEGEFAAIYGLGPFTIKCSDLFASDRMIVQVVQRGTEVPVSVALVTITNQLKAIDDKLTAATNVNWDALARISAALEAITNVDWTVVASMSATLHQLTNQVDRMTNQLGRLNWADIWALSNELAQIKVSVTNIGAAIVSNEVFTAMTQMLYSISTNIGNLGSQVSNVVANVFTNISEEIRAVTNVLGAINWGALSNMSENVSALTSSLARVDWNALTNVSRDVGAITSALYSVDWAGLTNISRSVGSITSAIYAVQWDALTNLAKSVDTITNALGAMRWDDINLMSTNMLALRDQLRTVDWSGLTNVSLNLGVITSAIYAVQWDALTNLSVSVADITNTLRSVNWAALTNVSSDMATITNALGNIRWSEVTAIADTVTNLSQRLGFVSQSVSNMAAKFAQLTAAQGTLSGSDIDALLSAMAELRSALGSQEVGALVSAIMGALETKLGRVTDAPGTATVFGRLAEIEQSLSAAGGQASTAAKKAQTARTAAATAAKGVQDLKKEIGQGNIEEVVGTIEEIKKAVAEARQNIMEIPSALGPQAIYQTMQEAAKVIQEFAASKGYKYIVQLEQLPGVSAEGVQFPDAQTLGALNRNMQEMRDSISFMKKLVEEMRYEPVVEESLVGVP